MGHLVNLTRWMRSTCPDVKYESETPTEKEEDDEAAKRRTATFSTLFEQNVGMITPLIADMIRDAVMDYPAAEWYEAAFRIAVKNNARNLNYVLAILKSWKENGFGWTPEFKKNGNGKKKATPPAKKTELTEEQWEETYADADRQFGKAG